MTNKPTGREALRNATLGTKTKFRSKIVKHGGHDFEIRQPSIKSRSELRSKCTKITLAGDVEFDMFDFLIWAVIKNTYVPGTDEHVFDETDYDALVKGPTGDYMDSFSEIAAELTNVDTQAEKKPSSSQSKNNSVSGSVKL